MRSKTIDPSTTDDVRSWPVLEGFAIGLLILVSIAASASFLYFQAVNAVKAEIREGVLRSTSATAAMLDGDIHQRFISKEQKYDPAYLEFVAPLERARQASKYVPYIYTNIQKGGKVYFVANPSPQLDLDEDGFPDDAPDLMDPYDAPSESLLQALNEQIGVVDAEPYTDQWGTFISAYVPFYNSAGGFVGTLGMDLNFAGFEQRLLPTKNAFKTAAITGVVMAILVGVTVWYNRRIVKLLNHSRVSAIVQYQNANEYVNQTNKNKAALLRYLLRSITSIDKLHLPEMMERLTLISELEDDNTAFQRFNFNLREIIAKSMEKGKQVKAIDMQINNRIPTLLLGYVPLVELVFKYLLENEMQLPINRITLEIVGETAHTLGIKTKVFIEESALESEAVTAFNDRMHLIDQPNEQQMLISAVDLAPAIFYKTLTFLGAQITLNTESQPFIEFSIPFDKFDEAALT